MASGAADRAGNCSGADMDSPMVLRMPLAMAPDGLHAMSGTAHTDMSALGGGQLGSVTRHSGAASTGL